ncbi:MAG: Dabb family protein [Defluviitaleaceae bacterium]|nr:Dabb family protein [Defluviitaleaceae bacterium]MCL2274677.1 Dabb family protein [Defluviitaleaceae bacterium]MCL2275762.1 Dabb family protein [Defluviitaleaceae bacterium]
MLKHIVMWNFNENLSNSEKQVAGEKVKADLEALKAIIPEIVEIRVHINEISSSNMDILLDSTFENEATMAAYKIHPAHVAVSDYIGTVLCNRVVLDYFT